MKKNLLSVLALSMCIMAAAQKKEAPKPPPPPLAPIAAEIDPPPPPPPPPPPAIEVSYTGKLNDDYKAFLKRNPAVKNLAWTHGNKVIVYLKAGNKETYDLDNDDEVATAEKKYGELPAAPPPPPPLPAKPAKPAKPKKNL